MDFAIVMKQLGAFFIRMCSIEVTFAGIEFTFGAMCLWCGVAGILISFLKGLGR